MAGDKEKRYVSDNAQLMSEWNWEKNRVIGLDPSNLAPKSNKKAWWLCKEGHEWQSTISNRTMGNSCPFCSGRVAVSGVNDLQTLNPNLAKEWNFSLNGDLTPSNVLPRSSLKVWWICEHGHEWQATVNNRTKGRGCPFCSGRVAISGVNDLQTLNPNLAKEWDYSLNKNLKPSQLLPNSNKKVWWKCERGHNWQATVNHRSAGEGCPICSSELRTSFPEYALLYYLRNYGVDALHSPKELDYELDVFIPKLKIAIEYDGGYWHRNRINEDLAKMQDVKKTELNSIE